MSCNMYILYQNVSKTTIYSLKCIFFVKNNYKSTTLRVNCLIICIFYTNK